MGDAKKLRCAIYTRKSSEEGLEQDFNSLHAQREACEAYIVSQKHEGWKALPSLYDDGGYSGSSMERPALAKLLADIKSRSVDVVVVYKVDRLTRSLTDFAKIVEVFDAHGVSFVSVTQAFNTTSSMGRLTLNVLLSFAQFEREVTGERIRDKIAASKKKGMWMGGNVPLGYQSNDRTLKIIESEAETVRLIFRRYLELRSVDRLQKEIAKLGLKTKERPGRMDHIAGGKPFSRGHLYRVLSNPIYAGKIAHKKQVHDGLHEAIIDGVTWDRSEATLAANHHQHSTRANSKNPSLLAGLLFDESGRSLVASHATKDGKRYRYYISRPRTRDGEWKSEWRSPWRIPAAEIEAAVIRIMSSKLRAQDWLRSNIDGQFETLEKRRQLLARAETFAAELVAPEISRQRETLQRLIGRIRLLEDRIEIDVRLAPLTVGDTVSNGNASDRHQHGTMAEVISLKRRNGEMKIVIEAEGPPEPQPDPALIKALGQAHRWWRDLVEGRFATLREIAKAYDTDERYAAWILRLAFISPQLTTRILNGTQPWEFTLHGFIKQASAGAR